MKTVEEMSKLSLLLLLLMLLYLSLLLRLQVTNFRPPLLQQRASGEYNYYYSRLGTN